LPDLVAASIDEYIQLAVNLAGDQDRLKMLRQNLRPQMKRSPLMNPPALAGDIETAYRKMWQAWCESSSAKS
jgi:predicted O-linked N-acetylglucosamine transferase (SPINDLY family)